MPGGSKASTTPTLFERAMRMGDGDAIVSVNPQLSRLQAAEMEHLDCMRGEMDRHAENLACEARRHREALDHLNSVFIMRLGA